MVLRQNHEIEPFQVRHVIVRHRSHRSSHRGNSACQFLIKMMTRWERRVAIVTVVLLASLVFVDAKRKSKQAKPAPQVFDLSIFGSIDQEHNPQLVCYVHIHSTHSLLYGRASHAQRKCFTTTNLLLSKQEAQVKDPDDPKQAHLSYGNNPLHDAARDGDMVLLTKILDRVPGTFTDNRFSKWSVMLF